MNDCEKWLYEYLKKAGTVLCDAVKTAAKEEGFSQNQLKAARKVIGVKTFHFFDEFGETPNWFWSLPKAQE